MDDVGLLNDPAEFKRPNLGSQRGIALFLVLWVMTLLSVIVGEFCLAMRTEVNITRNFQEGIQAHYIAQAGMNQAIYELLRQSRLPTAALPAGDENAPLWRINTDIGPISFGGGTFLVRIDNESGKVNLNLAGDRLLRLMLKRFNLDEHQVDVIVDSIQDWRDTDRLARLNGAEDDYYQSLSQPYHCKDGPFDTVEELLWVRSVTPALFYGGLRDLVTVYGDENSMKNFGFDSNRININAAPPAVLRMLPLMDEARVQAVIAYRKSADFKSLAEFGSVVGADVMAAALPYLTMKSVNFYRVSATGYSASGATTASLWCLLQVDVKAARGYRVLDRGVGAASDSEADTAPTS